MSNADSKQLVEAIRAICAVEHGPEAERRLAQHVADAALEITGFRKALVLTGGNEQRPAVACNRGVDERYARLAVEHYVKMPGLEALQRGESLTVPDIATDTVYRPIAEQACAAQIRAAVVVPMMALNGELFGAVAVFDSEPAALDAETVAVLQALVSHAGLALTNERLLRAREYLVQQTMLEKSQEIVSALVAGIAHDFNNLLGGVLGMVTLAPSLNREELKRLCAQLESHVDRASKLSRNLLELARASQPQDDVENTELTVAVADAVEMIRTTAHGEYQVDVVYEGGPFVARISPMAFSRVILNLLLNAVEALDWIGGGRIAIRLQRDDRFCVVEVDDDGPGIPPDREEVIFDPFGSVGHGDGSGGGLPAARGIVERAGGMLALRHREGPGACFQVRLPVPPTLSLEPERPLRPTPEPDDSAPGPVRLLLAEDEPVQRMAYAEALRTVGFEVDEVPDGAAATHAVEQNSYSALLLDHAMPEVTGASLLTALRAEGSKVPVVLVSGFGRDPQLTALAADPYTRVVSKPLRIQSLLQIIEELLS